MSIDDFALPDRGAAIARAALCRDARPRLRRVVRAVRARAARTWAGLLAALVAHTHRKIELALGEHAAEFIRAVRGNRAIAARCSTVKACARESGS